ncbi:hypothetical protein BaRGS_00012101, partial [Batillaria attramentaria]
EPADQGFSFLKAKGKGQRGVPLKNSRQVIMTSRPRSETDSRDITTRPSSGRNTRTSSPDEESDLGHITSANRSTDETPPRHTTSTTRPADETDSGNSSTAPPSEETDSLSDSDAESSSTYTRQSRLAKDKPLSPGQMREYLRAAIHRCRLFNDGNFQAQLAIARQNPHNYDRFRRTKPPVSQATVEETKTANQEENRLLAIRKSLSEKTEQNDVILCVKKRHNDVKVTAFASLSASGREGQAPSRLTVEQQLQGSTDCLLTVKDVPTPSANNGQVVVQLRKTSNGPVGRATVDAFSRLSGAFSKYRTVDIARWLESCIEDPHEPSIAPSAPPASPIFEDADNPDEVPRRPVSGSSKEAGRRSGIKTGFRKPARPEPFQPAGPSVGVYGRRPFSWDQPPESYRVIRATECRSNRPSSRTGTATSGQNMKATVPRSPTTRPKTAPTRPRDYFYPKEEALPCSKARGAKDEVSLPVRKTHDAKEVLPVRKTHDAKEVLPVRKAHDAKEVLPVRKTHDAKEEVLPVRKTHDAKEVLPVRKSEGAEDVFSVQKARNVLPVRKSRDFKEVLSDREAKGVLPAKRAHDAKDAPSTRKAKTMLLVGKPYETQEVLTARRAQDANEEVLPVRKTKSVEQTPSSVPLKTSVARNQSFPGDRGAQGKHSRARSVGYSRKKRTKSAAAKPRCKSAFRETRREQRPAKRTAYPMVKLSSPPLPLRSPSSPLCVIGEAMDRWAYASRFDDSSEDSDISTSSTLNSFSSCSQPGYGSGDADFNAATPPSTRDADNAKIKTKTESLTHLGIPSSGADLLPDPSTYSNTWYRPRNRIYEIPKDPSKTCLPTSDVHGSKSVCFRLCNQTGADSGTTSHTRKSFSSSIQVADSELGLEAVSRLLTAPISNTCDSTESKPVACKPPNPGTDGKDADLCVSSGDRGRYSVIQISGPFSDHHTIRHLGGCPLPSFSSRWFTRERKSNQHHHQKSAKHLASPDTERQKRPHPPELRVNQITPRSEKVPSRDQEPNSKDQKSKPASHPETNDLLKEQEKHRRALVSWWHRRGVKGTTRLGLESGQTSTTQKARGKQVCKPRKTSDVTTKTDGKSSSNNRRQPQSKDRLLPAKKMPSIKRDSPLPMEDQPLSEKKMREYIQAARQMFRDIEDAHIMGHLAAASHENHSYERFRRTRSRAPPSQSSSLDSAMDTSYFL